MGVSVPAIDDFINSDALEVFLGNGDGTLQSAVAYLNCPCPIPVRSRI